MTLLKTKEAAQQLAVSETTIRRWVSLFPSSFAKDMFGHYIFDEPALDKLQMIKARLEEGTGLYDIKLPVLDESTATPMPVPAAAAAVPAAYEESESLLIRLNRLETSLSHKADEVVSFQLLHHREELNEIRQTLGQLAASLEMLQPVLKQYGAVMEAASKPHQPSADRPKRRTLFRAIFPFL